MKRLLKTLPVLLLLTLLGKDSRAAIHVVEARNFFYAPASLSISLGDTVRFVWIEGNHPTASLSAAFATFPLNSVDTQFDLVLPTTGTYPYECVIHAGVGMVGTIVVTATSTPCGPASPPINLSQVADSTSAVLDWDDLPNALLYQVQGREAGAPTFGRKIVSTSNLTVGGLLPSTAYEWKVRALCAGTDEITVFSSVATFSTLSSRIGGREISDQQMNVIRQGEQILLSWSDPLESDHLCRLVDMSGRVLYSDRVSEGLLQFQLHPEAPLVTGIYQLQLLRPDDSGRWTEVHKSASFAIAQ